MTSHILLLHGALGASSQFESLIPLLEGHFAVQTLDFEGHGTSPLQDRPFRFSHFAEHAVGYLDHHNIAAVHVFGHSMGGHVGLFLARFFPDRVQSVFTFGTKFAWTPEIAAKENTLLDPQKMKAKVPHFVQTLQQRHSAAQWEHLLEKIREQHIHIGQNAPLSEEDIRQIKQRVRIGLGDRDKMVGLDESIHYYRLLADGELQVFPATPHPLEKISMKRLAGAIIDFVFEP